MRPWSPCVLHGIPSAECRMCAPFDRSLCDFGSCGAAPSVKIAGRGMCASHGSLAADVYAAPVELLEVAA